MRELSSLVGILRRNSIGILVIVRLLRRGVALLILDRWRCLLDWGRSVLWLHLVSILLLEVTSAHHLLLLHLLVLLADILLLSRSFSVDLKLARSSRELVWPSNHPVCTIIGHLSLEVIRLSPNILFSELHHIVLLIINSSDDKDTLRIFVNSKDPMAVHIEIKLKAVSLAIEHVASLPLLKVHLDLKFTRLSSCSGDAPLALDDLVCYNTAVLDGVLSVVLLGEVDCAPSLEHSVNGETAHLVASLANNLSVKTDLHIVKLNREILVHLLKVAGPEDLFACHFFVCLVKHFLSA